MTNTFLDDEENVIKLNKPNKVNPLLNELYLTMPNALSTVSIVS